MSILAVLLLLCFQSSLFSGETTNSNEHVFPSTIIPDETVPILSVVNELMSFVRSYLNITSISMIQMDDIRYESFGEDWYEPQTVFLRSHYSNEPIQAVHNSVTHLFYLNITSLSLSLFNAQTNKYFVLSVDLATTHTRRWAPISLLSSSHLPSPATAAHHIQIARVEKVRVMTMNLWNFNYWQQRLPLLDAILHRYKPDIIGLQELRIKCRYMQANLYPYDDPKLLHSFQIYDMLTRLSYFNGDDRSNSSSKFQWYSSPAMFFQETTPEQKPNHIVGEGLGFISRFPIIDTHKVKLSRDINDELDFHQRLLLGITVQIGEEHILDAFTTHLSLSERARNRTLPEIGQYINDKLQTSANGLLQKKLGAVLMGDFNVEFDRIQPHFNILSHDEYSLIDVWRESGKCNPHSVTEKPLIDARKSIFSEEIEAFFESPNLHYLNHSRDENIAVENDDSAQCKDGWTFNSWNMNKRIDYFYVDKKLFRQISDIQIVGRDAFQTIADLNPVGGVSDMFDTLYASDHRFIYLDIAL